LINSKRNTDTTVTEHQLQTYQTITVQ